MKKITRYIAIVSLCIFLFSCTQKEKLPPVVTTVEDAKKLLLGKTWQVVDVATVEGVNSAFDTDKSKNETVVAPAVEALKWLGTKDGTDNRSDFINSFYKDNLKISIALNKDSIATATGMETEKQIFSINNDSEENEPKGMKLTLTGDSKSFAEMGANKFTTTYYILGASENKLYLLTPNKLNSLRVVFLLESK